MVAYVILTCPSRIPEVFLERQKARDRFFELIKTQLNRSKELLDLENPEEIWKRGHFDSTEEDFTDYGEDHFEVTVCETRIQ